MDTCPLSSTLGTGFMDLQIWRGEEQTRTGLKSHFTPRDNATASTRCVHSPTHPLSRKDGRGGREGGGKKCVARLRESAATPHDYLATRTKLIIIAPFSSASRASERARHGVGAPKEATQAADCELQSKQIVRSASTLSAHMRKTCRIFIEAMPGISPKGGPVAISSFLRRACVCS